MLTKKKYKDLPKLIDNVLLLHSQTSSLNQLQSLGNKCITL